MDEIRPRTWRFLIYAQHQEVIDCDPLFYCVEGEGWSMSWRKDEVQPLFDNGYLTWSDQDADLHLTAKGLEKVEELRRESGALLS